MRTLTSPLHQTGEAGFCMSKKGSTRMAQTLAEQILSNATGRPVQAGENVVVNVDLAMMHDSITHLYDVGRGISHPVLVEEGMARPGMLIIGSDSHSTGYGCVGAFGTGMGTTDMALALASGQTWLRVPETVRVQARGSFRPGVSAKDLGLRAAREITADGATYQSVEWHGVDFLPVTDRMTLATLSIEVGGKAGIVPPTGAGWDAHALPRGLSVPEWLRVDDGARYSATVEIDLDDLDPQISVPHYVD